MKLHPGFAIVWHSANLIPQAGCPMRDAEKKEKNVPNALAEDKPRVRFNHHLDSIRHDVGHCQQPQQAGDTDQSQHFCGLHEVGIAIGDRVVRQPFPRNTSYHIGCKASTDVARCYVRGSHLLVPFVINVARHEGGGNIYDEVCVEDGCQKPEEASSLCIEADVEWYGIGLVDDEGQANNVPSKSDVGSWTQDWQNETILTDSDNDYVAATPHHLVVHQGRVRLSVLSLVALRLGLHCDAAPSCGLQPRCGEVCDLMKDNLVHKSHLVLAAAAAAALEVHLHAMLQEGEEREAF
mmetsp:Transcript_56762/g.135206  ORF Transcript_56762/g.135206 Transcript_56762/m.135206 type:complete len:294 (-) Transcript_56762:562-1443(-)